MLRASGEGKQHIYAIKISLQERTEIYFRILHKVGKLRLLPDNSFWEKLIQYPAQHRNYYKAASPNRKSPASVYLSNAILPRKITLECAVQKKQTSENLITMPDRSNVSYTS